MMLEAENLVKYYDAHPALKGLNLKIEKGEIFCLLGANGAGKTTTIQLFLGFIEPTSGSAKINGMEVATHPLETVLLNSIKTTQNNEKQRNAIKINENT